MKKLKMLKSKLADKLQHGASLVEYILLVALIAVVCIVALRALGSAASSTFNYVANQVGGASG